MDIQLEKYKLMEWLVNLKDEAVINTLKTFKNSLSKPSDWADDISETEKLMIIAGLKDIADGNTIAHDQVMKEIKDVYGIQYMEVVWSKLAKITYKEVLENLKKRWTTKEMNDFQNLTIELLDKIKKEQVVHPFANQKLGVRKGLIHKNVSLFYKEDKDRDAIYLITFFNNKMDPDTLKLLLKA